MLAAMGLDEGRGSRCDQIVPTAHASVPKSSAARGSNSIGPDTSPGVRLSATTPATPQAVPMISDADMRERERIDSNTAIQTGINADTMAAMPESTRCSAQKSGP